MSTPKELGASWKELAVLKKDIEKATSSSFGVQREIKIHNAEWAEALPDFKAMMKSLQEFEEKAALHRFWTFVFTTTNSMSSIKRKYNEADMAAEMGSARSTEFLSMATDISKAASNVHRTLAASRG